MQAVLPSVARALAVEDYACSPRFPDANSSPPSPQEAATHASERWTDTATVPSMPCAHVGCKRCAVRRTGRCAQHPPPLAWCAFHARDAPACLPPGGCVCNDPSGLSDALKCERHGAWVQLHATKPPHVHLRCTNDEVTVHLSELWPADMPLVEVGGRVWLRNGRALPRSHPPPGTVRVDWMRASSASREGATEDYEVRQLEYDLRAVANWMRWALPPLRFAPGDGGMGNEDVPLKLEVVEDPLRPHRLRLIAVTPHEMPAGARLVLPPLALCTSAIVRQRRAAEDRETTETRTQPAHRALTHLLADMAANTPADAGTYALYA